MRSCFKKKSKKMTWLKKAITLGMIVGCAYTTNVAFAETVNVNSVLSGDISNSAFSEYVEAEDNITYYEFEDPTLIYTNESNSSELDSYLSTVDISGKVVEIASSNGISFTVDGKKIGDKKVSGISVKDNSKVFISGDVKVDVNGGFRAVGVELENGNNEVVKGASLTIDGNLTMRNDDEANLWGVSKLEDNNTALKLENNTIGIHNKLGFNSKVEIDGVTDLAVNNSKSAGAIGVLTSKESSIVNLNGGARIITPKSVDQLSYSLAADEGIINVNMKENKLPAKNKVVLEGDLYTNEKGIINVALINKDSSLKGTIDNKLVGGVDNPEIKAGNLNIWLENGAKWENKAQGKISNSVGSFVNSFKSGENKEFAGDIFQGSSLDLNIDNYSGYTNVFYEHDSEDINNLIGGDFIIKKASKASFVNVITDKAGIDLSKGDTVDSVLNSLANKLIYKNYVVGERNLKAQAIISEGLTSSSATKAYGDVSFNEKTGKGLYDVANSFPREIAPGFFDMVGYRDETINETAGMTRTMLYKYDKEQDKIIGANITSKGLDRTSENAMFNFRLDATDLDMNNPAEVYRVISMVQDKLDNQNGEYAYKLNSFMEIANGSDVDSEIIRKWSLDDGRFAVINGVYTSVMDGDLNAPSEYDHNGADEIELAQKAELRINFNEAKNDNIYAAINPKNNRNMFLNASYNSDPLKVNVNINNIDNANGYGIYNDKDSLLKYKVNGSDIKVTGASDGAGIYANYKGIEENGVSKVHVRAQEHKNGVLSIQGENIRGIEAGSNGEIFVEGAIVKANTLKEGLFATDGGKITVQSFEYLGAGNVAARAEKDGVINIVSYDDLFGIKQAKVVSKDFVTDETGKINFNLKGETSWHGNTDGNVNINLVQGASWKGTSASDKTSLTMDGSSWEIAPNDGFAIGNVKGGVMPGREGTVFQSSQGGDVSISHFAGISTFVYEHDASDENKLKGGEIKISSASKDAVAKMYTDKEGIDLTNETAVNDVLDSLAHKLVYTGFITGEGNLTGLAEIGEGLTTSSIVKKVSKVNFNKTDGRGEIGSKINLRHDQITGSKDKDTEYQDIIEEDGSYTFKEDTTLELKYFKDEVPNGYSSIISNRNAKDVVVNMQNNDLVGNISLEKNNSTDKIYGIAANTEGSVTINNAKRIDLKLSPYNGSDFAGISAQNSGQVIINNDGENSEKVYISGDYTSLFRSSLTGHGIEAKNKGIVDIKGLVNIDLNGKKGGITALDASRASTIKIGGGKIKTQGAKSIKNDESNIYINVDKNENDINVGKNDVEIVGSVLDNSVLNGEVVLGLATKDSSLTGAIEGEKVDLFLSNNAVWNNNIMVTRNYNNYESSENISSNVRNFVGGTNFENAGLIYQNNTTNISLNNYEGFSKVFYEHDSNDVKQFNAGTVTVGKANQTNSDNAAIKLITDQSGIDLTDETIVNGVLDSLSHKLIYANYITGERNLDGFVEIAEGLTSSSISKETNEIEFNEIDGVGKLKVKNIDPPVKKQDKTEFTMAITGNDDINSAENQEYYLHGVLKDDGSYNFTKETTIKNTLDGKNENPVIGAADANGKDVIINASEGITFETDGSFEKMGRTPSAIQATKNGNLVINADVTAFVNGDSRAAGVMVPGKGYTASATPGNITINGDLTMRRADEENPWGVTTANANFQAYCIEDNMLGIYNAGLNSTIKVTGAVDIAVKNGNSTGAYGVVAGDGKNCADLSTSAFVNLEGGGRIITQYTPKGSKQYSLGAIGGTINMNVIDGVAGDKAVKLEGDIVAAKNKIGNSWTGSTNGKVNVALTTNDSYFKGAIDNDLTKAEESVWSKDKNGEVNMWLSNGATWEHRNQGNVETDKNTSYVRNFVGGDSLANAGVVNQITARDISVANYSGNTVVLYDHDADDVTNFSGGDFVINHAAKDSVVTLRTDNVGIDTDDEDVVTNVLDSLAAKLTYQAYVDGEENLDGYTQISEGLTSSSLSKRTGEIKFSKENGVGSLKDDSIDPNFVYPTVQDKEIFNVGITGDLDKNSDEYKEYYRHGVLKDDGSYNFTKENTEITINTTNETGIKADTNSIVVNSGDNIVKIIGSADNFVGISATNGGSVVTGKVDITAQDGIVVDHGTVSIAGGKINASRNAIVINNVGTVNINTGLNGAKERTITSDIEIHGNLKIASEEKVKTRSKRSAISEPQKMINIGLGSSSTWTGTLENQDSSSEVNLYMSKGATWFNKNVAILKAERSETESVAKPNVINNLVSDGGIIEQIDNNQLIIDNLQGNLGFYYNENMLEEENNNIVVNHAELKGDKKSSVELLVEHSLITNDKDKDEVEKVANKVIGKISYKGTEDNFTGGNVALSEGLVASSIENIGKYTVKEGENQFAANNSGEIIYGNYETAMMRGAKSAMISSAMNWRSENNDLGDRIGEIVNKASKDGIWARVYGGKMKYDNNNTDYSSKFKAMQVGFVDKANSNGWRLGAALSYLTADSSYELGGSGESESYSLATYGSWNDKSGTFIDLVASVGKISNDYTVYNDYRNYKLDGDYDNTGLSVSAKIGKKIAKDNGTYLQPELQLTYGHLGGDEYTAHSSYNNGTDLVVKHDGMNSLIGRIGIGIGRETESSNFYGKVSYAREFSGDVTTSFYAPGEPNKTVNQDFGEDWFELRLGGTTKLGNGTCFYGDIEKTFGGDIETEWKANAGLRWSF